MKSFFFLLTAALTLWANGACHAQDSLRMLSWNIQMLPRFVNSNGKGKRAKAIVQQLESKNYDVIVFQEAFKKRSRRIITKGLKEEYPHHTSVLNKKTVSFRVNGGVMIFSRYPIDSIHQIEYKARTGFDKFSRKGAIMVEIVIGAKRIQVAGTHLQAFGPPEVMYAQYEQLGSELLVRHARDGVPQLICGDFNTIKSVPAELPTGITQSQIDRLARYPRMLQVLNASDGELHGLQQYTMDRPYNDLCKTRKEFRLLLDYVLLRNSAVSLAVRRQIRIMQTQWHKDHKDLSDHYGLEAVVSGF